MDTEVFPNVFPATETNEGSDGLPCHVAYTLYIIHICVA